MHFLKTNMKQITVFNRDDFRKWLMNNHDKETEVSVIVYKRHTGNSFPSHRELMEEAICFGWIDTIIRKLDEEKYIRTFSKRNKNSKWSNNTLKYAKDLIKRGKMTSAGLKFYKEGLKKPTHDFGIPKNPDMPVELKIALDKEKKAKENFEKFPPSTKKMFYRWILSGKREETRAKRIKLTVEKAKIGNKDVFGAQEKMLNLYEKHHTKKEYTMVGLFREIKIKFNPKKVLYPGCYVHITPSLVFYDVTYIDSFRNTNKFFEDSEVREYINKNKEYKEKTKIKFYHQDYFKEIQEKLDSYDLVISLYGGFVGQAVKKYLKKGGILVCNNSHGDASMASIDPDYELIAVFNRRTDEKFSVSNKNLDKYLIPKNGKKINKKNLEKTMRGIAYTKSPSGYIFKKK